MIARHPAIYINPAQQRLCPDRDRRFPENRTILTYEWKRAEEAALHRESVFASVFEFHGQIASLLADAEQTLVEGGPERTRRLALLRWQLVRTLRSYQLFKHLEIFDPLIGGGTTAASRLAREMKDRCCATGTAFEDHVRRWSSGSIDLSWQSYECESSGLIARLRSHVARERSDLDRLLADVEDVRKPRSGDQRYPTGSLG